MAKNQHRTLFFALILLFFAPTLLLAQLPKLTNQAKVVLFTCDPGEELYAGFGHSALWITDPVLKVDRLYNYGTFNFRTPGFYTKFVRGKLDYMLSVTPASYFIDEYKEREISVYGQNIDLSLEQKQTLFSILEKNYRPENRFYKYDFFFDNCATRLRDVVDLATNNSVQYNEPDSKITYRELLFPYLKYSPWIKLGINLIVSLPSDKIAPPVQYMYLPDYLRNAFESATITTNGVSSKLVTSGKQYLKFDHQYTTRFYTHPVSVFALIFIFIAILSFIELKYKKRFVFVDRILLSIAGFAGFFMAFLWLGTDHKVLGANMNILWALPSHLYFAFSIHYKSPKRVKILRYTSFYMAFVAFMLLIWPQYGDICFTLISLTIALRYWVIYKRIEEK